MKKSSYLKSLQYETKYLILTVEFTDGAVIRYYGVPARTFRAIETAQSPGEKFSELVRHRYQFSILNRAA